jgi:hypothetical protein
MASLCLALVTRARIGDQVGRIPFAENCEGFLETRLLDQTMASEIPTGRTASDEVLLHKKCVGASVVARSKMYLGQPECIIIVV